MGRIFERFGTINFHNEAEVSNNFVIPLFKEFLGYKENEILPERLQPSVMIPLNRDRELSGVEVKIKPDFMLAIDGDINHIIFSFDSKGPNENLDNHLRQLLAYSISVGVNLVGTTNGKEFRVYNANDLIFQSADIETLDLQFPELLKILHKNVSHLPLTERIQSLSIDVALGRSKEVIVNEQRRKIAVRNSDFTNYLHRIINSPDELDLPPAIFEAFQIKFKHFSPEKLFAFLPFNTDLHLRPNETRTYNQVIQDINNSSILIVGESGIGKTSLLLQIAREYAEECLRYDIDIIPVVLKLCRYTGTTSLKELISIRLSGKGANISELEVTHLIGQRRLLLLLDAYDEVIDTNIHNLQQEIEIIIRDLGAKVVITTRHFRLPQLSLITKYEIQSLTPQKISAFAENYLGEGCKGFLDEMMRKNLRNIASNTMILTFLILLYSQNHNLPNSRTKVIDEIVYRLQKWAESKTNRFQHAIPWQTKRSILSDLALVSFVEGDSYTLNSEISDNNLARMVDYLAHDRKISQDMQISEAYSQLEDTGLIYLLDNGVSFWHRAFQEYLASFAIAEKIQSGEFQIGDLIRLPKWESILPSVASRSSSPDILIIVLLSFNIFTAAKAIIETNLQNGSAYESTVECLKQKSLSPQRAIRQIAVNLLKQIDGEYVGEKFRELLESKDPDNDIEHIQKIALVEIARRKIPKAREIVYSRLSWHSYSSSEWFTQEVHAGAAVVEALSWFDDEESQLLIIERWKHNIDFPMRDSCRDALVRISNRGSLCSSAIGNLLNWFVSQNSSVNHVTNNVSSEENSEASVDYWGMMEVFIAAHDINSALLLIPVLITVDEKDQHQKAYCIIQILKSFNEPEIIKVLVHNIEQNRNNLIVCGRFLDVLSEIEGDIPNQIFWDFAQSEIPSTAKAYAIRGLGRLPFDSIKSLIITTLHPPSPENLWKIIIDYRINQILHLYNDIEIFQAIKEIVNEPSLQDDARSYVLQLISRVNKPTELLQELAKKDTPREVKWGILMNNKQNQENSLLRLISDLLESEPYEYSLMTDPCDYPCVQDEIFSLLHRHGYLSLFSEAENKPIIFYDKTAETLFDFIRLDKIFELEPLVLSIIEEKSDDDQVHIHRMIIKAAWVLASLGNFDKAKQVIEKAINADDSLTDHKDWIIGDILSGIDLMPPDYALAQIGKIWANINNIDSILIPSDCIEALERIGTKEALDMIGLIYEETKDNPKFLLVPERALRAIQFVSPFGREEWLINLLQQNPQEKTVLYRAIDMLGVIGNKKALPIIQDYSVNNQNERVRYCAFWAMHNIYEANNEVWYNGEETGCVSL